MRRDWAAGRAEALARVRGDDRDRLVPSPSETSKPIPAAASRNRHLCTPAAPSNGDHYNELGRLFADVLDRG